MIVFNFMGPQEVAEHIAERVKARRLELNLTQRALAMRAGLSFSTYRRFEQTSEISLKGLLQIAFALNALTDFDALFSQPQYQSLDEALLLQKKKRQRGKKND